MAPLSKVFQKPPFLYTNNFKADYSGIKSKGGFHIIRPNLEKEMCKKFENWSTYRIFDHLTENFLKFF